MQRGKRTGAGLGGWNCRHSFHPYYEGSPRTWTDGQLARLKEKTVEYNGEKLTEYEATQKQRYMERKVREWKREAAALEEAGLDTGEAAVNLKRCQAELNDFLDQPGLKRQGDREAVAGWAWEQSKAAALEAEKRTLTNAAGQLIVEVKRVEVTGKPNSLTQRVNRQGGIDRNYYGPDGKQTKQVSNYGHGHNLEEAIGEHGEHAHDYTWDEKGNLTRGRARELTDEERRDNDDFLGSNRNTG